MNYFSSTEIGIVNLLQRQFDWEANTLFIEEIPHALDPSRNKFIVANGDAIICGPVSPTPDLTHLYEGLTTACSHSASRSI
jgi:hypothetical protein